MSVLYFFLVYIFILIAVGVNLLKFKINNLVKYSQKSLILQITNFILYFCYFKN